MNAWKIRLDDYPRANIFHEFAVEWTPKGICFFTNGIKVMQFTNKKVLDKWFNNFGGKHRVLINHNLKNDGVYGTRYLTQEDYENYYSEFKVDYIRVYQYDDKV